MQIGEFFDLAKAKKEQFFVGNIPQDEVEQFLLKQLKIGLQEGAMNKALLNDTIISRFKSSKALAKIRKRIRNAIPDAVLRTLK